MINLQDEQINKILDMNFEQLYALYKTLSIDYPKLKINYHKIRFGIKISFDIHDHFEQNIKIKLKKNIVSIGGKICNLTEYRTEIEDRESLCRQQILENITTTNQIYKGMKE